MSAFTMVQSGPVGLSTRVSPIRSTRVHGVHHAVSAGASWSRAPLQTREGLVSSLGAIVGMALGLCAAVPRRRQAGGRNGGRCSPVTRHADMKMHARDPKGVKHIETKRQAMKASLIKQHLQEIFLRKQVQYRRLGDDEFQRRIFVDDVIMSRACRAAWIHVSAEGDKLEQRQAFVWLVRNKGGIKTALAKRLSRLGQLPQIFFVESQFEKWHNQIERANRYPELNLPDPFARIRKNVHKKMYKKWGIGDPTQPYDKRGYEGSGYERPPE